MSIRPALCIALSLPGSSGAGALVKVNLSTFPGCAARNASIASWTSWRVPATSTTLMVTGPEAFGAAAVPSPAVLSAERFGSRLQPARVRVSPTNKAQSPDCLRTKRVSMGLSSRKTSLEPVGALRQPVCEVDRHLARLVLVEPAVGDQPGQKGAVHPARDVVAPGDRQECPRVIVEADGIVEAGRLGGTLA